MARLHVVLGSSGGAGSAVVRELAARGQQVRAVSRSGRGEPLPGVSAIRADATNPATLRDVCRGASVVYHCVNVPYPMWATHLLPITNAIVEAAASAEATLVVADNLYMYGRPRGPMTEETRRAAAGRKGRLRVALEQRLLQAHRSGRVRVAIGRASDFLGPGANSAPMFLVVAPAKAGRAASWIGTLDAPHTLSYLPDVAWGLVTLGEREEAQGEIWHLPAAPPLTGRQFIAMVFQDLGRPPRMRVISWPLMRMVGLFSPLVRESLEVFYQFAEPFVMDATKFTCAFGSRVTPHEEAVRRTVQAGRL